ncbi:2Fe-2S iron-sulfur cluster-binding protein [Hansschlegelia sp. KR7-227]|uniref:2Fe-2S iron-sulfur cluster-binding protein n=1 Tax=Hansschlegelia sp. KR7-227 TaxID=3400914 RepID=UPI003C03AAF4
MSLVVATDLTGAQASFFVDPGERILHAGLRAGVALPFECASGTCGTCKASCASGEIEDLWPEAPARRTLRRAGEVLTCQTTCASPVELRFRDRFGTPPETLPAKLAGELRRVALLTADVARFEVEIDRPVRYRAGQFALLEIPGVPGARAYSMTRHQPDERRLTFLIRNFPGGGFSSELFGPTFAPRQVELFGPLGRSVFRPEEERPFVAVAGGSGIAGMLSILDQAGRCGHYDRHPSELVFGLRSPAASYLLDELDEAAAASRGGLTVHVAFSDEAADDALRVRYPHLEFAAGLVHDVALARAGAAAERAPIYFVAGPPPMVDATTRGLVMGQKALPTEIRFDRFG